MARVCVIGAGPAGCVFAARLAQLGHEVTIVERRVFPRTALGESLSPGVLPLLDMIGARGAVDAAGFTRVRSVITTWDGALTHRDDPGESGLLVDRERFDGLLLEQARALGVRVLQPATLRERRFASGRWSLILQHDGGVGEIAVDLHADAGGRRGAWPGQRERHPVPTLALYAYWRGTALPAQPRIEAGTDAWYWGVPLPGGRYNTLVFLDASTVRERAEPVADLFLAYLNQSGLMDECAAAHLDARVRAIDATPYIDRECVTPSSIKVGDAALAIDPLSSSGVQKAIQSALAAAIVVNTMLRRPESSAIAMQFYRTTIEEAAARHRAWAASHYATVAARQGRRFWLDRAAEARAMTDAVGPASAPYRHIVRDADRQTRPLNVSPLLELVDLPCIDGEMVTTRTALRHPRIESPVAYLGGWELSPLLRRVQPGMTAIDIVRAWSERMPLHAASSIVAWLVERELLVSAGDVYSTPAP
jgi:flavin-dependent dehydrogenase